MKKRIILIGGVTVLLIVLGIILLSNRGVDQQTDDTSEIVSAGDPIDPTTDFYKSWLDAVKSTTTNPVEANLIDSGFLSESVRQYITSALANTSRTLDPVLCQTIIPNRIGVKVLYELDASAQLLILARGAEEKTSEMAVVDLVVTNNQWQISKISCSNGEVPPEREFSFEREVYLLKSVPQPLNSDYWHIVFEENSQKGHTAPLFLNDESRCTTIDDIETVCNESQFKDATKIQVQGEMTETGVEVKKIKFLVE